MKRCTLAVTLLVCAVALGRTAFADAIPFSYNSAGVSFAGTFFGTSNGNGSWTVTGVAGTYNHVEVVEVLPPGDDPYFAYNNLYYDRAHSPYSVDYLGIVFQVPGLGDVNLCSYTPAGGCGGGGYASILWEGAGYELTQLSEGKPEPPVPEPTSLALLGGGLAAAALAARRRLAK